MQATRVQDGRTIDHTAAAAISAGDVVMRGDQPMVAPMAIANGSIGVLTADGVYDVVKDTSTIVIEDDIYWHTAGSPVGGTASSGAANNVAVGGYLMGKALASAATGVTKVRVKLLENVNILRGSNYPYSTHGDVLANCTPQGTRETDTTQNYALGTKRVYQDGRVFRYVKARTALHTEFAACYNAKTITNAVAPTQATGIGSVGSYYVKVTVGATDGLAGNGAIAADELKGGYIVMGNGSAQHPQNRQIVANTVVAAGGGVTTITLDEALDTVVTASTTNIEVLMNPWILSDGNATSSSYVTFRGMPAVEMDANDYGWVQTAGPCWITSDSHTCDSAGDRQIYFVANGSVVSGNDVTSDINLLQLAGHAIDASSSGASNAPFVNLMLEVSA